MQRICRKWAAQIVLNGSRTAVLQDTNSDRTSTCITAVAGSQGLRGIVIWRSYMGQPCFLTDLIRNGNGEWRERRNVFDWIYEIFRDLSMHIKLNYLFSYVSPRAPVECRLPPLSFLLPTRSFQFEAATIMFSKCKLILVHHKKKMG